MTTTTTTRPPATSWQALQPPAETDSGFLEWDTKTMVIGTAVGAAIGLAAAWMMVRSARDARGGPPHISTGDLLKVGITTIGLMRAIAALGED